MRICTLKHRLWRGEAPLKMCWEESFYWLMLFEMYCFAFKIMVHSFIKTVRTKCRKLSENLLQKPGGIYVFPDNKKRAYVVKVEVNKKDCNLFCLYMNAPNTYSFSLQYCKIRLRCYPSKNKAFLINHEKAACCSLDYCKSDYNDSIAAWKWWNMLIK